VELAIESVANTMTFSKTALSVPTGAEVHLTLKNNSTMTTLPHNWVLVKTGTEASVAAAGLKYGEPAGFIDIRNTDMIVHTPLAKPGESTEVTFTAPDPGAYPYVCTVPGHYMMMKGVLTVTP
jgi:azurin